jgi:hypothetical protein
MRVKLSIVRMGKLKNYRKRQAVSAALGGFLKPGLLYPTAGGGEKENEQPAKAVPLSPRRRFIDLDSGSGEQFVPLPMTPPTTDPLKSSVVAARC